MTKNSNIYETKREFSAHTPTDTVRNHKQFNTVPNSNLRIFSKLSTAKTIP